jgi:transposase
VRKLLRLLMRYPHGARQVWRVGNVPSVEAEDRRHLHRALETVQQERARTTNRIKGLRRSQGVRIPSGNKLPEPLDALRRWAGSPVPSGLRRRVLRVSAHYQCLNAPIAAWEAERRALLRPSAEANIEKVRQVMQLKGIGINGSWLLVMEVFGWRQLTTRRAVGG